MNNNEEIRNKESNPRVRLRVVFKEIEFLPSLTTVFTQALQKRFCKIIRSVYLS